MFIILIAEDEPHLRAAIAQTLTEEGYQVKEAKDGQCAFEIFCNEHIDLVITDIMMPKMDGNKLTASIRQINMDIPILMLTALETIDDKDKGFKSGTDDYLVKPVELREVLMRVKALLRRYKLSSENKIELKNTILDYSSQMLKINGQFIELSKKEFLLLFKLLSHPDVVFSREQLLNEIWGYASSAADRTVDTHVSWLRDKAKTEDFEIVTVWGLGYKARIKF